MKLCHKCKAEWKGITQPGTKETCVKCGEDLHICLNCRLYDNHKPYQCMETDIDPVKNKERYNFCEHFQFKNTSIPESSKPNPAGSKNAFNNLFKKQ
ncbi:MAG: hypothetical protein NT145_01185 [Elusimicrobia bacterium]|nr:hypothetical protein [Elusimicrobiota bacterium]